METPLGWNATSNARPEVKRRDYEDTLATQIGSEIEARVNQIVRGGGDDLFGLGRKVLELPHVKSLLDCATKSLVG